MSKSGHYSRRDFIKLTGAGLAAGVVGFPAIVRAQPMTRNVIVLGIDGMDPHLLLAYMAKGLMPNAKRLIDAGSFARLRTSNPPQSPVAWSSFISGTNPGGHGIYDFIARDPVTRLPYFSTSNIEGEPETMRVGRWKIPISGRKMVNLRRGPTFWNDLQKDGIDCTVLKIPANFPPTESSAKTLSGLGTPDIHGSYGIFTFYTDKGGELTRDVPGGHIEHVEMREHAVDCVLPGPLNTLAVQEKSVDIPFKVFIDPENPVVRISIQGTELVLQEGELSNWVSLDFSMMPHVVTAHGICRFFLKKARNDFELYVSPVNIDPSDPFLPISTPDSYAGKLTKRLGLFYTQGMAEDTSALMAKVLDDDEYRQQAGVVLEEDMRLFEHELSRFSGGFFFFYFSTLDLNSHAFWRTLDTGHPLYTEELARKHGDFLPWLYGQMDKAIGRVIQRMDDRTLVMVMSDHGFASFRRQFNLNSWLMDNSYASPKDARQRGNSGFFGNTDWHGTKAYGLGINSLYLNIVGREEDGVVRPGTEAEQLSEDLIAGLKAVRDPDTGDRVISNVFRPSDIYSGPHVGLAPDLIVGYNRNYRASWDTILGKYTKDVISDNTDPWSGDHVLDAALVPGVLLCNRKIKVKKPGLEDLAPTILSEYGVPIPVGMTGKRLMGG